METETRPATPIRLATADDVGALARVSRLAYAATYPDIVPADVLSEWIESAGATWQARGDGLPDKAYLTILREAFDSAGEGEGLELYFGATSGEVFGSTDAGATWRQVGDHLPPVYSVRTA